MHYELKRQGLVQAPVESMASRRVVELSIVEPWKMVQPDQYLLTSEVRNLPRKNTPKEVMRQ